jgi:hypothetical protein
MTLTLSPDSIKSHPIVSESGSGPIRVAQMPTHEASHTSLTGQLRDVSVQIHPINTLQFQDDMFALKLGNTFA